MNNSVLKAICMLKKGNLIQRHLYAAPTLGIDGYKVARGKIENQFLNNSQKFREKMKEFVDDKPGNIIFTEDLKNMIHLADNKDDVELTVKMIKRFNTQNKEIRFGNFVFGPVVLRMLYFLNDPDTALECVKDPSLVGFFDQIISFQILMDMLYEKKRYTDVLEVFDLIKSRQIQGGKYPKHIVVLAFAACYKMNTEESFDYSKRLWQELKEVGHTPMRKAVTFAAGLALLQNAPHVALEMLGTLRDQHYMTVRNTKALAYAEIDRPEDALPILRSVLEIDQPTNFKGTFLKTVVNKVKESIERNGRKEIESDFNRIEKFLSDNGHLSDQTLDDILCTEITETYFNTQRKQNSMVAATFERDSYKRRGPVTNSRYRSREGLQDLY